ncbi:MAG: LysM peptidoglycan-binding domain-containing protein [bacterium]|nr:LysM peptidoglycan-binding domain-containing protein [bacterium]
MRACSTLVLISIIIIYAYRLGYNRAADSLNIDANTTTTTVSTGATTTPTETEIVAQAETLTDGAATVTHNVTDGETLFLIGLKYDVLWTTIASANAITENTPLKTGMKLIIPLNKNGQVTKTETLNISADDGQKTQTVVNHGEQTWRKDVLEVVRRTMPVDYHLINDDPLSMTAQDKSAGTATVEVQHGTQKFIVELIQPQDKGDNGIWYIAKISNL